ncbi:Uncharacterised protein [Mycolicibacterium phlei]|jgi:hypothetical protein|uniref:Secreted protein n=1 Tax=Mycolicibacterium phlei DSM 43239 = CCUG 21000 TaxID=1226750 RepID=A0A5N5V6I4_MYCPH|nr:hypothetical protein [Mycolicibacterium phlei]VEG09762.1 Uncharacterised protein [Mycobacteroides chelonae]AMO61655.1 hypothetical protein MPHLCCUG_02846 [Mycolicibacterium phlei]EID18142.1 hypothetical protein MPHLEI_01846 [Mycolicibacterium phlei RIVM601174]KAB7757525.1 hypothetical protein MPHL21000_06995 [Mycolicibacterium phlei DSM 43239 = CCUG 21000]KXW67721.1 hypothetical protein MPHL43239_04280 [Mycolicibacterium phlei DSM 43239 = CCUG 21000]
MGLTRTAAVLAGAGVITLGPAAAAAEPPPDVPDFADYPVAQGNYRPGPPPNYHVFFRTPDGWSCGIGPNGGPIGCDGVPADAPPGTNQTFLTSGGPAEYRYSDTATFTREGVDVLPPGHRLENWGAGCAMGHQGALTCQTYGGHGFTIAGGYGVLW